jgi:tetratricopeptide (TPR) repeat protein
MKGSNDIFSDILERGPSEETVLFVLTKMKEQGRLGEVIQGCTRFLVFYSQSVRLRMLMVESCLEKGFIGLAQDHLQKLTGLIGELVMPYKLMAKQLFEGGLWAEGEPLLDYYLAHHPEDTEGLALLKQSKSRLQSSSEPEEPLPVDFATPTIAELYYEQGQLDAAIATYERVVEEEPGHAEAVRRLTELKAMTAEDDDIVDETRDLQDDGNRKVIGILERWLPKVREIPYARDTP